jgi:hypothetical protein
MPLSTEEITKLLVTRLAEAADASRRTDNHWQEIGKVIQKAAHDLDTGFLGATTSMIGLHKPATKLWNILSGDKSLLDRVQSAIDAETKIIRSRNALVTRADKDAALIKRKQLQDELLNYTAHQAKISEILSAAKSGPSLFLYNSLKITTQQSALLNQELIQASANYATRAKLSHQIAQTQVATGASMQSLAKAASALVGYGIELDGDFKSTLNTVIKMEEGLGVSVDSAAQMAVVMKRIGADTQRVADGIARVKSDTGLAAEDATKFATQIGKAVMMLKPGSGSLVDQTTEYLDRLAGALKQVGGNAGDIVELMTGFTTEKGMLGAATLGATPDFLADPANAKIVAERFTKFVSRSLLGTSGFQRWAVIDMLAEQFGTTREMIVNAEKMMDKYNKTQREGLSLQDEWRQQTSEINKAMSQIKETGMALVQQALLPILQFLRPVFGWVAEQLQGIAKSTTATVVVFTILGASAITATVQVARLGHAVMVMAAEFAAAHGLMKAGGLPASLLGPGFFTRIASAAATGPVLGVIGALVGGWILGRLLDKFTGIGKVIADSFYERQNRAEMFKAQTSDIYRGGMGRSTFASNIQDYGLKRRSEKDLKDFVSANFGSMRGLIQEGEDWNKVQSDARMVIPDFVEEIRQAKVKLSYTTLSQRTPEDRLRLQQLEALLTIASNGELQAVALESLRKEFDRREQAKQDVVKAKETRERLESAAVEAHRSAVLKKNMDKR